MDLYTPSADSGFFNLLGKLFGLGRAVDAARTGSVLTKRNALEAALDLFPEAQNALSAHSTWDSAGSNLEGQLTGVAVALLRRYISEKGLVFRTINDALETLRRDLVAGGYYFASSTKSLTVTPATGNTGDVLVAVSDRNTYGEPVWIYPESIVLRSDGSAINVSAEAPVSRGDASWPGGSGAYFRLPVNTFQQSLLRNAGFEVASANIPDGWTIHTGTPGTTVLVTEPEEQQITISGNPTGGYFVLTWTDPLGRIFQTEPIGYAPTASEIQSALQGIRGLEAVTVTGTNPFTVTFEKTPGDINQLGAINKLTGGTSPQVTITTTRPGDVLSYRGRALKLVGNGSEQTTLYQMVRLQPGRVYFLLGRARRTATASGEIRLELRRAVNDTPLSDSAGNLNRITVSVSSLPSNQHTGITGSFRLPADFEGGTVALVITASTPIPNGQAVGLDELVLVEGSRLYPGGPYIAVATGWKPFSGDSWTITASNNLAGKWELTLERFLQWRSRIDRSPPGSGTTQIPDSLLD
ncbi:MAG: hypothetical protein H5U08_00885 [Thermogutta sp.]|uniref:hypothetical protein n=1 Tax=Thermogutta sp. TaxID=1962930 RepID=UPI001986E436|nr:hypothetical protein [Thermogutta sp.]MBC7350890.1 hypothetical protein [Thermogutta sp.]